MISVARTGSGKTCGFLLPVFEQLLAAKVVPTEGDVIHRKREQSPTVLVLAPTRELAIQIDSEAEKFSEACELVATCLYGGVLSIPSVKWQLTKNDVSSTMLHTVPEVKFYSGH